MIFTMNRGPGPRTRTALLLAALSVSMPALADTKEWIGDTSAWNNAAAWSPANQPANGDQVLIKQDGANVSYISPANPDAVFSDMEIDSAGANLATFSQADNTLNTNQLFIGVMGQGAVNQSGGAMNVLNAAAGMSLGGSVGGHGTYTLSNSAILTVAGQVVVGDVATGVINQSGGRVIVTPLGSFPGQLVLASNVTSTGTYNLSGGSVESGSIVLSPFGGNATFNHSAGSVTLSADLTLGDPTIGALAGQAFYNHTGGAISVQQLNIGSSGTFKQNSGALQTKTLTIAGGKLDITSGDMSIDYTGTSPLATVRDYLKSGYSGGSWNGSGIVTSSPLKGGSVAYAEASDLLGLSGVNTGTWDGQTVDSTSLLLKFTLTGDATMDGEVSFADLVTVAQNYGTTTGTAIWRKGDFDFDGNVGFSDLVAVAQNYGAALPSAPIPGASLAFEGDLARAFAAVPEPSMLGIVVGMVPLLLRRRRAQR
jgi:hypothetical protein